MLTVVLGYKSHSRDAEPQFIYAGHKKSEAHELMDEAPPEIVRFDVIEAPTVRRKANKNAPKRDEELAAEKAAAAEEARIGAELRAEAKKKNAELKAARLLVEEADAKEEADAEDETAEPKKKVAKKSK